MSASYNAAVLMYHSLDDSGSVISTRPEKFRDQMQSLKDSGATVMSLQDLISALQAQKGLPANAVAITFDDGFRNVFEVAFPILKRHGFPATVFLVTDFCGKDNNWYGQPDKIPVLKLLDWDQIQEMAKENIEFGAHTATHPHLSGLREEQIREEVLGAREMLCQKLGKEDFAFAYPYGQAPQFSKELVKNNFYCACSTQMGFVSIQSDIYFLPRIDAYYFSRNNVLSTIGTPVFRTYVHLRRTLRNLKEVFS